MYERKLVGDIVFRELQFLRKLLYADSMAEALTLIQSASYQQLRCLVEIARNIRLGNFRLRARQVGELRPHARAIRALSRARTPAGVLRVLRQRDGLEMLAIMLDPVVSNAERFTEDVNHSDKERVRS